MAGIAFLRRLLMKQAMKKSKDASGIMSLNKNLVNDVDNTVKKWVDSAKSQGQDIDKMGEQEIKYLIELNKPKGPMIGEHRVIDATSPEGKGITESLFGKKGEVVDLSGKKIDTSKPILGGRNLEIMDDITAIEDPASLTTDIITETIAVIKSKKPIDAMAEANSVIGRKGKYKNLTEEQSKKILKDTNDHIFERDIKYDEFGEIIKPDPEDLAGGGRTGYDNGKFVSDPTEKSPKNFYNLGIGPDLGKFMSEGVPRDEKGFHTTLNKEDLKYMWEVLQGKHPIKDIEDELMFRFGRVNPEKKSEFFAEIGKDKGGIGWKKKFAGGGRTSTGLNYLLGEDDQNSRVPYGLGGGFNAARRAFLKMIGAGAATGVAAKSGLFSLLKAGKPTAQVLTSVPIGNASGMPAWFKPLVNKVIKEGDDVTKKFATKDREIVHRAQIDKDASVDVIQDLDTGNVRLEYDAADNLGYGPIQLDYKAGEVIEQGSKRGTKTKPEFSAVESEPRITNWDGDIEFDGENIVNVVDDLLTDTTKLETYATGKNPNIKKLLKSEQKKKYVNKLNDDQMEQLEYIENKQGHTGPDDLMEAEDVAYHKYKEEGLASGGRVPLGEGGDPGMAIAEEVREAWKDYLKEKENGTFKGSWKEFQPIWIRANLAQGGRVPLGGGKLVLEGLEALMKKFFPGTTKLGKTSRPMAEKTQLKQAIAKFQEREAAAKPQILRDGKTKSIIPKDEYREYKNDFNKEILNMSPEDQLRDEFPGISDRLIRQILTDKNPQRIAEVKQTMREALKMQEKGMGHEEIIEMFKKTPRTKNASGGRVSLSAGGLAGMLGE